MSIRIVTDSTCDIPVELVKKLNISVVPMTLIFGDEELRDGVDITSEQFFKRLARDEHHPTTAQPAAGVFRDTYERLIADGATEIVSIHVSSRLSGTLESARQGAAGLPVRIILVDSQFASLALGVGVLQAARAVEGGVTAEQARGVAEDVFRRSHIFFTLETLEYLRKGGRLSRGQELIGSLLKVKPLITIAGGEVEVVGRVRTKQKAMEELVTRVAAMRPLRHTMALHATTPQDLTYLSERLRGIAPDATHVEGRITPVVGVHVGPGAVGIGCVTAPDALSPDFLPA